MTAACGIDCEICELKAECGGCFPGTDPRAKDRADELKRLIGLECPVFRCAVEKKVDYCLRCDSFPCDIHYKYNYPYSDLLLDNLKLMKEYRNNLGSDEFYKEVRRLAKKYSKSG
jgi:hypothetical protein